MWDEIYLHENRPVYTGLIAATRTGVWKESYIHEKRSSRIKRDTHE